MKWDFLVGNPPYNDEQGMGEQKNFAKPVYHAFIDAAYQMSDKVELIHPARFLYNAGATPKEWNEKMLSDAHLKVLRYDMDSRVLFGPNVTISGGIVITYHDNNSEFGAISVFSAFQELNGIIEKVVKRDDFVSLEDVTYIQTRFNLDSLYAEHPEYQIKCGKDNRLERNIFEKVSCFSDNKVESDDIKILGMSDRKRAWKYIPARYIQLNHENLFKWKIIVSTSNGGAGNLGKEPVFICGEPIISCPGEGYTRTFLGIGSFDTEEEAINCVKYIKSKFCRCMLGILKATQLMNREVWRMIPLQNFSENSDIDWSKPIRDINSQLYEKYRLTEEEKNFIEQHIKEMN